MKTEAENATMAAAWKKQVSIAVEVDEIDSIEVNLMPSFSNSVSYYPDKNDSISTTSESKTSNESKEGRDNNNDDNNDDHDHDDNNDNNSTETTHRQGGSVINTQNDEPDDSPQIVSNTIDSVSISLIDVPDDPSHAISTVGGSGSVSHNSVLNPSSAEAEAEAESELSRGNERGWIKKIFFVDKPIYRDDLKLILHQGCNWMDENDQFQSYTKALHIAHLSNVAEKIEVEIDEIYLQLLNYMEGQNLKLDLIILAFAIHVLYTCTPSAKSQYRLKLFDSILKSFCFTTVRSSDPRLWQRQRTLEEKSHPCTFLSEFLRQNLKYIIDELNRPNDIQEEEEEEDQEQHQEQHLSKKDQVLAQIAGILMHHCGSKPKVVLPLIIPYIDPNNFRDNSIKDHPLLEFLEPLPFHSLALYVQSTLEDFCAVFDSLQVGNEETSRTSEAEPSAPTLVVLPDVQQKLEELITNYSPSNEDEFILRLLNILNKTHFRHNSDQEASNGCNALITSFVTKYSYSQLQNFSSMIKLWVATDIEHSNYTAIREAMVQTLKNNFSDYQPSLEHVISALTESGFLLLVFESGVISKYTNNSIKREDVSFEDKLAFLDILFKSAVKCKEHTIIQKIVQFVDDAVDNCRGGIIPMFYMAHTNKALFHGETSDNQSKVNVINLIAKVVSKKSNVATLQQDDWKNLKVGSSNGDALINALTRNLISTLQKMFIELEDASIWYSGIGMLISNMDDINATYIHKVRQQALSHSIANWKPHTMKDILNRKPETLLILAEISSDGFSPQTTTNNLNKIVSSWVSRFDNDKLEIREISAIERGFDLSKWEALRDLVIVRLPDLNAMLSKIDEFENTQHSICEHFCIKEEGRKDYTIQDIFRGYSVDPSTDSDLELIIQFCTEYVNSSENVLSQSLENIRTNHKTLIELRKKYEDQLYIASYFLSTKSLLFQHVIDYGSWSSLSVHDFFERLSTSRSNLSNLLRCKDDHIFRSVKDVVSMISDNDGNLHVEVDIIASCPTIQLTPLDIEQFYLVASLVTISDKISGFVKFWKHLQFAFAEKDEKFAKFEEISCILNRINDHHTTHDLSLDDLNKCSSELHLMFLGSTENDLTQKTSDSLADLFILLDLFSYLSQYIEVWTFMDEMRWFGEDGLKRFNEMYENVTNVILADSESFEMAILYSLEPIVRLLSFVGLSISVPSFEDHFDRIKTYPGIMKETRVQYLKSNLLSVHQNISSVRDWFGSGVDEISAIFNKFDLILWSGEYIIQNNSLCLRYRSDKTFNGNLKSLDRRGLNDFVKQLGFVRQENAERSSEVAAFIDQYQAFLNLLEQRTFVTTLGFDDIDYQCFPCPAKPTVAINDLYHQTTEIITRCEVWMTKLQQKYPASLLFWIEELRLIHNDLRIAANSANLQVSFSLFSNILTVIYPGMPLGPSLNDNFIQIGKDCLEAIADKFSNGKWLETVSIFIETYHNRLDNPLTHSNLITSSTFSNGIYLHMVDCDDNLKAFANLFITKKIFQMSLPRRFEILDCQWVCSVEKIKMFLLRVAAFPSFHFLVLNTQDLSSQHQELLINFISSRNKSNCVNVHFVQHTETTLDESTSIKYERWSNDRVREIMTNQKDSVQTWLKNHILQGNIFERISVVYTSRCGTGKTRYILEELKKIRDSEPNVRIARISIHEGSSLQSLVQSMLTEFNLSSTSNVVYFSFMVSLESGNTALLDMLNYFFRSLFLTKSVQDLKNDITFHLGCGRWKVFVELPSSSCASQKILQQYVPVLGYCGSPESPPTQFHIDDKARRVCTYLRAYHDGTIDRKFQNYKSNKQIMFVIDKSGSMGTEIGKNKTAQDIAIDNAVDIFNSHVETGDLFGTILFDRTATIRIPLTQIRDEYDRDRVVRDLRRCRSSGGGTELYSSLLLALKSLEKQKQNSLTSWIICLTDGISGNERIKELRKKIQCTSPSLHLIIIGVNLRADYENQMRLLCNKYAVNDTKGLFVSSQAETGALKRAFTEVAAFIPISQTFQFDGALNDDDCRLWINKFLPDHILEGDMLLQKFWIKFLYRRVTVLDQNKSFNYNETCNHLGSSLMKVMLYEAEQLLTKKHKKSWKNINHQQLIYDFTNPEAPEFRLICTAPDKIQEDVKQRYIDLDLPGFSIPSTSELSKRSILDRFLAQAIDIPLIRQDNGTEKLACIDENKFVLTLDFTMKLLNLHESFACRIPCIIEGETGVSKTALTKMYSIMRNSSLKAAAEKSTSTALREIVFSLKKQGFSFNNGRASDKKVTSYERIQHALRDASDGTISKSTDFGCALFKQLRAACVKRDSLFQGIPSRFDDGCEGATLVVSAMLKWFSESILEETFFEINVDASISADDIVSYFESIQRTARKISDSDAIVVVFLDEVNTSPIMGLFKEILIDHCILGKPLESNIVVVAACNPAGRLSMSNGAMSRENDRGKEWTSGHYQVNELPSTMNVLKWEYGALDKDQEREFVLRRMEMLDYSIPKNLINNLTELVITSHQAIRIFAASNIHSGLQRFRPGEDINENEVQERASSVVSLRDIQRVFSLFDFFINTFPLTNGRHLESMYLTIAVVYYFKLDGASRRKFIELIANLSPNKDPSEHFEVVLNNMMTLVADQLVIPPGIALTEGLKENIFMTVICSLSFTPLVMIGPPGTSKTLSIHIVSDNASGEESQSQFFRKLPRLSTFHYQCSRTSTSKEVASVFDKAIQRQETVDVKHHKCLVFLDEAGLPEEQIESLKVLHYYLEGHMSMKAKVGFVAITNHVLDAAKSNRCVSLLRQEPGRDELIRITNGVLFGSYGHLKQTIHGVEFVNTLIQKRDFANKLCDSYTELMNRNDKEFDTFFGLRDFIYFLRYLRSKASVDDMKMKLSPDLITRGLERNFNGIHRDTFLFIVSMFLSSLPRQPSSNSISSSLRDPLGVISDALTKSGSHSDCNRYALIIDDTEDDSVVRLLHIRGLIDNTKKSLFKLSKMPENMDIEELNLICGVKYAAMQGATIVLSQTDSINESFYDLFNQHFRRITNQVGEEGLFANIAVGGVSRRSRVSPSFNCIVHVRESDLPALPAAFLKRFEKYRLTIRDVLSLKLQQNYLLEKLIYRSIEQVEAISDAIEEKHLCGFCSKRTIESFYLDLIGSENKKDRQKKFFQSKSPFIDHFVEFVITSLRIEVTVEEITSVIGLALKSLPSHKAEALQQLLSERKNRKQIELKKHFKDVLTGEATTLNASVTEDLLEMVMTRKGCFMILSLAALEDVVSKRSILPPEIMSQYFTQNHFTLKRVLGDIISTSYKYQKHVVHTRSDPTIFNLRSDQGGGDKHKKKVEDLVHDHAQQVLIESLSKLRNSAALRSAIESWYQHEVVNIFLLVVDMAEQNSIERINYIRCCIDQLKISATSEKLFMLVLHYPPAAFLTNSFYPAIFLNHWQHQFLDGIGGGEYASSSHINDLVTKISQDENEEKTC